MRLLLVSGLVLPWLVSAFLGWLVFTLIRQHGRALLGQDELRERLDSLERSLAAAPAHTQPAPTQPAHAQPAPAPRRELPVGTQAPAFTLPGLDGAPRTLESFLGAPLVILFFDPACGFCADMAPRMRGLEGLLVVSRGDADTHRRLASEHGWRCDVVLQGNWEVSAAFRAGGTPTGYLLDSEGRIASTLAVGADGVLSLLDPGGLRGRERTAAERARAAGLSARPANRQGLPEGTAAPGFELPAIDGTNRSLGDYRGSRVLLVFSDPDCGPCDAMAPDLVGLHERTRADGLQIVMIGRGDVELNKQKARRLGYEFPVLVQRRWEVSAKYGMFATPVAYLVDGEGVLASGAAVGAEAILALAG